MKAYMKQALIILSVSFLPLSSMARTTAVQEYNFNLVGPKCKGDNCQKQKDCSAFPYTCLETGLKGVGETCYDTKKKKTFYKKCECNEIAGYIKETEVRKNEFGKTGYYASDNSSNNLEYECKTFGICDSTTYGTTSGKYGYGYGYGCGNGSSYSYSYGYNYGSGYGYGYNYNYGYDYGYGYNYGYGDGYNYGYGYDYGYDYGYNIGYYGFGYGYGCTLDNHNEEKPISSGGVTCYKRKNIKCKPGFSEYTGASLPSSVTIRAPITTMALKSNACVEFQLTPLLTESHQNDNILCLSGYACKTANGCYNNDSQATNSNTGCFVTGTITEDKIIDGQSVTCYSPQRCKTTGACSDTKPVTGISYTMETKKGVDSSSNEVKDITCYKAIGCMDKWLETDTSNIGAFKEFVANPTIVPTISGSHSKTSFTSMEQTCNKWTTCNRANGWENYTGGRGVGASAKSAAVVAAAYENNVTYEVSVLSSGTGENMHYFICRRPTTAVCPQGTYNDECSEANNCSWLKFFLPD